jgi:hypothetical protein
MMRQITLQLAALFAVDFPARCFNLSGSLANTI